MNKGPKISIITACYNAENTIEQTIQSVLGQTYENIEYIIVDGASTDGTMEIVNNYKEQIDIIISESDEGIYDAFNKGARAATGDYIQYLNADDYLIDKFVVDDVYNEMKKLVDVTIIYGGVLCQNDITGLKSWINKEIDYEKFRSGNSLPHQAVFTKRETMLEMGLFDTKYEILADYDLTSKIFKKYKGQIYYIPRLISIFRIGGISSQLINRTKLYKEMDLILQNVFQVELYYDEGISNEEYLKIWLEKKNFEKKNIAHFLNQQNLSKVAIWGTGVIANLLVPEFNEHNINVEAFIDNDIQKQNVKMNNIVIHSPEWLVENQKNIDAIIFGFEGKYEDEVRLQLANANVNVNSYSWKELIEKIN